MHRELRAAYEEQFQHGSREIVLPGMRIQRAAAAAAFHHTMLPSCPAGAHTAADCK